MNAELCAGQDEICVAYSEREGDLILLTTFNMVILRLPAPALGAPYVYGFRHSGLMTWHHGLISMYSSFLHESRSRSSSMSASQALFTRSCFGPKPLQLQCQNLASWKSLPQKSPRSLEYGVWPFLYVTSSGCDSSSSASDDECCGLFCVGL